MKQIICDPGFRIHSIRINVFRARLKISTSSFVSNFKKKNTYLFASIGWEHCEPILTISHQNYFSKLFFKSLAKIKHVGIMGWG